MKYVRLSGSWVIIAEAGGTETISEYVGQLLVELLEKSSGTVLSLTAIAALWSSSKGFYSVVRGLDSIYRSNARKNYFVARALAALYTLLFALLLIVVLFIFVFGNQIYLWSLKFLPILSEMALLIISVRTIVGFGLMILFFSLMYMTLPGRKSSFFAELPGAIITSAGWLGFSYLFSFYIDNFSNYSATYGSLTAVVLCMLWFYSCMYIMFIGFVIDEVKENGKLTGWKLNGGGYGHGTGMSQTENLPPTGTRKTPGRRFFPHCSE